MQRLHLSIDGSLETGRLRSYSIGTMNSGFYVSAAAGLMSVLLPLSAQVRRSRCVKPPKASAGATADARGFVGAAFRTNADGSKYECFYIRPTNGRAEDQLRRNHSTQYISFPDYEWNRLRTETPGKYESYVDLVPGKRTMLKIVVNGTKAQLYVNGAAQPVLIVNDLKLGDTTGAIALWVGVGTEAYFADLRVSH